MQHTPPHLPHSERLHWATGTTTINIPRVPAREEDHVGVLHGQVGELFLTFFFNDFCSSLRQAETKRGSWSGSSFLTDSDLSRFLFFPLLEFKRVFKGKKETIWGLSLCCEILRRRVKKRSRRRGHVAQDQGWVVFHKVSTSRSVCVCFWLFPKRSSGREGKLISGQG